MPEHPQQLVSRVDRWQQPVKLPALCIVWEQSNFIYRNSQVRRLTGPPTHSPIHPSAQRTQPPIHLCPFINPSTHTLTACPSLPGSLLEVKAAETESLRPHRAWHAGSGRHRKLGCFKSTVTHGLDGQQTQKIPCKNSSNPQMYRLHECAFVLNWRVGNF